MTEELSTYRTNINRIIRKKAYRDADFTAGRLAEMIGVEGYELSRILKKVFGTNFTALVNELRVKDAIRLLMDERLGATRVDDVGAMVGFGNKQTFYSEFRKQTGCTPAQYRKENCK